MSDYRILHPSLKNTLQHLGMGINSHPRLSNSAISVLTVSSSSSQRSMSRQVSSPRDTFGPAFGPAGIPVIRKNLCFKWESRVDSSPSSPTSPNNGRNTSYVLPAKAVRPAFNRVSGTNTRIAIERGFLWHAQRKIFPSDVQSRCLGSHMSKCETVKTLESRVQRCLAKSVPLL